MLDDNGGGGVTEQGLSVFQWEIDDRRLQTSAGGVHLLSLFTVFIHSVKGLEFTPHDID